MPQSPDAIAIADADGATIYSSIIAAQADMEQRADILNASDPRTDAARDALAHPGKENADGAQICDFGDHQYGRRVEADRSWTVYHVVTDIPAHVNGATMVGLSHSEATRSMQSLNF